MTRKERNAEIRAINKEIARLQERRTALKLENRQEKEAEPKVVEINWGAVCEFMYRHREVLDPALRLQIEALYHSQTRKFQWWGDLITIMMKHLHLQKLTKTQRRIVNSARVTKLIELYESFIRAEEVAS